MNRYQWIVFGIGFGILSYILFTLKGGICIVLDNNLFVGCMVRRYAYAIPAVITHVLAWIFLINGILEFKWLKKW